MRVTIVYSSDCLCVEATHANLNAALALLGKSHVQVELQPVESVHEAETEQLHGSPTVLLDGRDPFAPDDAPTTLACRPGGAPTIRQLLDALA
jgi:hypothetical protein